MVAPSRSNQHPMSRRMGSSARNSTILRAGQGGDSLLDEADNPSVLHRRSRRTASANSPGPRRSWQSRSVGIGQMTQTLKNLRDIQTLSADSTVQDLKEQQ